MGRMRGIEERPAGLRHQPDLLDEAAEQALLSRIRPLTFDEVRMHGQVARRTVRHYGMGYEFSSGAVTPGEPIPDWLVAVRARCAALAGVPAEDLVEALVTRYPPGAGIGWHRDAPAFGDVVGVSLASSCALRFQRGTGEERRVFELLAAPRSAYVLTGPARTTWQHSIPAVAQERYSITFRTVRRRWAATPEVTPD
jgi:alkylated DNA repair dioxygenase AlkB